MNNILRIIDAFIIRDILLELVLIILLLWYLYRSLRSINMNRKTGKYWSNYMEYFVQFLFKLEFISISVFLIISSFVLGILEHSIIGCLITKFIVTLGFIAWVVSINIIEVIFTVWYFQKYSSLGKSDVVWVLVKTFITLLFLVAFLYLFYWDVRFLFV